jgi:hypothetical protein
MAVYVPQTDLAALQFARACRERSNSAAVGGPPLAGPRWAECDDRAPENGEPLNMFARPLASYPPAWSRAPANALYQRFLEA